MITLLITFVGNKRKLFQVKSVDELNKLKGVLTFRFKGRVVNIQRVKNDYSFLAVDRVSTETMKMLGTKFVMIK